MKYEVWRWGYSHSIHKYIHSGIALHTSYLLLFKFLKYRKLEVVIWRMCGICLDFVLIWRNFVLFWKTKVFCFEKFCFVLKNKSVQILIYNVRILIYNVRIWKILFCFGNFCSVLALWADWARTRRGNLLPRTELPSGAGTDGSRRPGTSCAPCWMGCALRKVIRRKY